MSITIFTDGAARGNPGPGGWGAVVAFDKSEQQVVGSKQQAWATELGGHTPHTTNNRMELTAVIESLKFLTTNYQLLTTVTILTDSEYVLKGITVWVKNWQEKNWRTAAKKAVLNQDLWQELLRVSEGKEIKWQLVRGHSGVSANERCDVIATAFADLPAGRQVVPIDLYDGPRENYHTSLKF